MENITREQFIEIVNRATDMIISAVANCEDIKEKYASIAVIDNRAFWYADGSEKRLSCDKGYTGSEDAWRVVEFIEEAEDEEDA